jgi:hypothetical protein
MGITWNTPAAAPAASGGIKWNGPTDTPTPATPAAPTHADILGHITNVMTGLFPGTEQVGNALGENLYGIWQLIHGNVQGFQDAADEVGKNNTPVSLGGAAASAIATPASMLIGGPEAAGVKAAAQRVAVNTGVGAALGGANAAATKGNIASGALGGAAISAGGSTLGETLNGLLSHLPVRLVRGVLPKLKPGNEQAVLQNTKLGSVKTMLEGSQSAVSDLGQNIKKILTSPQYAAHTGEGNAAVDKTLAAFPNSEYDAPQIVQTVKNLVPEQSKLISKIQQGTATLDEKNTVRQALDTATQKRFTDHPQLTSQKTVGAAFADNLRREVQSNAPETQPVFRTLSKEINVRNALDTASKKLDKQANIGLLDILSYLGAGLPALLGEKAARSPGVSIATAKALSGAGKALPTVSTVGKALRPSIIKAATSGPTGPQ